LHHDKINNSNLSAQHTDCPKVLSNIPPALIPVYSMHAHSQSRTALQTSDHTRDDRRHKQNTTKTYSGLSALRTGSAGV
jgi:hypothetical protein